MVDVKMKTHPITGRERPQETDFNDKRKVVRVLPRSDDIRKYLKHQPSRVGFLATGSAEWPNDTFTKRRIAEGDVTIEAAAAIEDKRADAADGAEPNKVIDKSGAKAAQPNDKQAKPE